MLKNGTTKYCETCKVDFYVPKNRADTAKYCSMLCLHKNKERAERISKTKSRKVQMICLNCKKDFSISPSRQGKRIFCSKNCLNTSEHIKERTSKIHKGKKAPYAKPPIRYGAENHFWKGGITPVNAKIRNSPEYKAWRKSVFERDDYTCQICKQRGLVIHADHIKQFAHYPELRFELSNGRTLCMDCHKKTPSYLNKKKITT